MEWNRPAERVWTVTYARHMLGVAQLLPERDSELFDSGLLWMFRVTGVGYEPYTDHASLEDAQLAAETWLLANADQIPVDVEAWSPPAYEALEAGLREAGFEPTLSEPRALVASAGAAVEVAVIYLSDRVTGAVIDRLVGAVFDWLTSHARAFSGNDADELFVPLYGPDGEVLREVRVPTRD